MVKRFSDWINRIKVHLFRGSKRKSRPSTAGLYTYDSIPLTLYLEVAQTGNTDLIVISGNPTQKEIDAAWEEITRLNSQSTGRTSEQLDNIKDYVRLLSKYSAAQASIMQLHLCVDDEAILYLASNGYKIDTSSNTAYRDTLKSAQRKAANVVTKIESKYKEIMDAAAQADPDTPLQSGIETMLAAVSATLGFNVESNVTLARFNEYNKIIKKRVEAQKNKV